MLIDLFIYLISIQFQWLNELSALVSSILVRTAHSKNRTSNSCLICSRLTTMEYGTAKIKSTFYIQQIFSSFHFKHSRHTWIVRFYSAASMPIWIKQTQLITLWTWMKFVVFSALCRQLFCLINEIRCNVFIHGKKNPIFATVRVWPFSVRYSHPYTLFLQTRMTNKPFINGGWICYKKMRVPMYVYAFLIQEGYRLLCIRYTTSSKR